MTNNNKSNSKQYDLEERTFKFARDSRVFIKKVPRTIANIEDSKQLARSTGSQAANYIEANEALSKKDFVMRVKICKKEAKESRLWLRLIDIGDDKELEAERNALINECEQLMKIFGSIIEKLDIRISRIMAYPNILSTIKTVEDRNRLYSEIEVVSAAIYKEGELMKVLSSQVSRTLAEHIGNETSTEALSRKISDLKKSLDKLVVVKLTLAYEPSQSTVDKMLAFLRRNLGEKIILDLGVEPLILGGVIF